MPLSMTTKNCFLERPLMWLAASGAKAATRGSEKWRQAKATPMVSGNWILQKPLIVTAASSRTYLW